MPPEDDLTARNPEDPAGTASSPAGLEELVAERLAVDRARAEIELQKSHKTFSELIERAPFGIYVVNSQFRIVHMNASSLEGAFRNVRPALGRDFAEAMHILWPEPVAEEIIAHFRHTLGSGEPYFSPRFVNPRHDVGTVESYEWELHRMTLPDGRYGVICYYYDSTKLREAEAAVQRERDRLSALVSSMQDEVWFADAEERLTLVNPAVVKAFGAGMGSAHDVEKIAGRFEVYRPDGTARPVDEAPPLRALRGETVTEQEEIVRMPATGQLRHRQVNSAPVRDEAGQIIGSVSVVRDITEHKQAEEALRLSEERFSKAFNLSPSAITITRLRDGMIIEGNESAYELLGYGHDEVVGKTTYDLNIWADIADRDRLIKELLSHGSVRNREFVLLAKGGRPLVVDLSASLITIGGDRCFLTSFIDITERKRTEEALQESQAKYQNLIETTSDFIWELDSQGRYTYCSPQMERLWGIKPEEMVGKTPFDQMPLEAREEGRKFFQGLTRSKSPFSGIQVPSLDSRGDLITIEISGVPFFDAKGELLGYRGVTRDVTERERAQKELLSRDNLLSALTDNSPDAIYVKDAQSRWLMANPAVLRIVGKSAKDALGKTDLELYADPEIGKAILENDRQILEEKEAETFEEWADTPAGRRLFLSTKAPWFDAKGDVVGLIGISHDITELKKAEELHQALAEQENLRLGAAVEQASDAVIMIDLDGTIRYVNAAFESINGMARKAAAGTSYFDLLTGEAAVAGAIREAVAAGQPWHGPLIRSVRDGRPVELEVTVFPAKDLSGAVTGGLITEKDVTRENALQNQVRQAQKMEALGTLAGGITHDFNNILGTIILNTELALLDLDPANPGRRPLPLVLQAANRGRELVKQIITFSRQRTWEKKPIEIAPIIGEGMRFLRTALSKDIAILETIEAGSGVVLADPSHINQVLANLCQNAALAMREGGGRLEVTLAPVEVDEALAFRYPNLKPGPYARLTVSDTGCGMTKELQERIFEPFFTTRGPREGSGLGLAVVLGIVRTYDGEITVTSELGKGSTFDVYFPRLEGEGLAGGVEKHEELQKGEERVLLVEDEEAQRTSLERGLAGLGYKVAARADGRSALETFREDPSAFDVVVTDQIMPRMTGLELASEIAALRPGLPIILCTGFSERVSEENVGKSGVCGLLMKPFSFLEATRLIRKVLG